MPNDSNEGYSPDLVREWLEVAEALFHSIHCSDDAHGIEAEQAYLELWTRTHERR